MMIVEHSQEHALKASKEVERNGSEDMPVNALWRKGTEFDVPSVTDKDSIVCVSVSWSIAIGRLHWKQALTILKQISKFASVDGWKGWLKWNFASPK
jgi:hypothetical protein